MIKVCIDPHCEAVYHNIPKKVTRCDNCGCRLCEINEKTWGKKFSNWFFQYDYETGEYFRPEHPQKELAL